VVPLFTCGRASSVLAFLRLPPRSVRSRPLARFLPSLVTSRPLRPASPPSVAVSPERRCAPPPPQRPPFFLCPSSWLRTRAKRACGSRAAPWACQATILLRPPRLYTARFRLLQLLLRQGGPTRRRVSRRSDALLRVRRRGRQRGPSGGHASRRGRVLGCCCRAYRCLPDPPPLGRCAAVRVAPRRSSWSGGGVLWGRRALPHAAARQPTEFFHVAGPHQA